MKSKSLRHASPLLWFAFATAALADNTIQLQDNGTIQSILQHQVGQSVELRMKSGEKIGGKLEKLNEKVAHLTQLTDAGYFEAVVVLEDIAAMVLRAKNK